MTIEKLAVNKALAMLKAAGCRFKIIESDGLEHGELLVAPPPPARQPRRKLAYPLGTFSNHFQPYVSGCEVGQKVTVPYGRFQSESDKSSIHSALTGYLSKTWGNGSYFTLPNILGVDVIRSA